MPIIDFSNPITVLLGVVLYVLVLILGKETHKAPIPAVMLFAFLAILVGHAIRLFNLSEEMQYIRGTLSTCMVIDFVFVFLSFIGYLWIDDIQARVEKKKSIDNSLDWFWAKV